jgi:hypothetical protein
VNGDRHKHGYVDVDFAECPFKLPNPLLLHPLKAPSKDSDRRTIPACLAARAYSLCGEPR